MNKTKPDDQAFSDDREARFLAAERAYWAEIDGLSDEEHNRFFGEATHE